MAKQKLNVKIVANTLAIVTVIVYVVQGIARAYLYWDKIVTGNYFMGLGVGIGISYFVLTMIFYAIVAWIIGYLFAVIYNKLVK